MTSAKRIYTTIKKEGKWEIERVTWSNNVWTSEGIENIYIRHDCGGVVKWPTVPYCPICKKEAPAGLLKEAQILNIMNNCSY